MSKIVAALVAAFLFLGGASQVSAAPCAPHQDAINLLRDTYGESLAAIGFVANGAAIIEIFVNPDTGSFTIVSVEAENRLACGLAVGVEFTWFPPRRPSPHPDSRL